MNDDGPVPGYDDDGDELPSRDDLLASWRRLDVTHRATLAEVESLRVRLQQAEAATAELREMLPTWYSQDAPVGEGILFGFEWVISKHDLVAVDRRDIAHFAAEKFRRSMEAELTKAALAAAAASGTATGSEQ